MKFKISLVQSNISIKIQNFAIKMRATKDVITKRRY